MDSEEVDGNVHSVILSLERSHRLNFVKLLNRSHHAIVLEMVQLNQADVVAVKVVEKPRVGEEKIWRNLNHPNVVPLIDMVDTGHGTAFFMPMVGGNMQELLEKKHFNKQNGGFRRVKRCLYDILNGLNYLHQRGLLHGSLELTNVLVAEDGRAILCGFSLLTPSRWAPRSDRNYLYVDSQREQMKNGKEVDMWCFGCMALEVFTGKSLGEFFQDPSQHSKTMMAFLSKVNDSSLIFKLLMQAYPEDLLSDVEIHDCWMFLHHLLVPRGKLRMNAEKALTHSFFSPVKSSDDASEHISAFEQYLSGSGPHLEIHRSLAYSDVCYLRNTGSTSLSLENTREKFTSMESEDPHLPVVEEGKDPSSVGYSDFSLNRHQDLCDNDLPNPDCGYFSLASKLREINMSTKDNSGIEVKIEEVSPGTTDRFTVDSDSLKENILGRSSLKHAIFSIGEETEENSSTKALLPEQQDDDDCEIEITEIIENEIPEAEECQGISDQVVSDEEVVEIFPKHEATLESFVESGDLRKRNSEEWRRSGTGDASEGASDRDSTSKTRLDIPFPTSNKLCSDNSNFGDETKPQSYDQREVEPSDSLLNVAMLSFFSEQSMRRLGHNHLAYEDTEKFYHDKNSKVGNTTLQNSSLLSRMDNLAIMTDIALANCNESSRDVNSEEDTAVRKKVDEDAYSMGCKMAQTRNDPMSLEHGKKNNGEKLSLSEFRCPGNIDLVNGQSTKTVSIETKLAWQNSKTKSDSMDYTSGTMQRKPHNYKTLGVKLCDEVWEVSPKRDDHERASRDPKSPKKIPDERALLRAEGDGRQYCAGDTSNNRPRDSSGKQGDKKKEIGDFPRKDKFKDPGDKENDIEKDESPLFESIVSPTSATHGGFAGKRHLQWNCSMPYRPKTNAVTPEYPLPGSVGDSRIGFRNGETLPKVSARLLRSEEPEVLTVDSVSDPEQEGINDEKHLDRTQSDKELAKRSRDDVATDPGSYYSRESWLSHPVHRTLSSPTTSPKNGRKSDTDHPKEEFELKQYVRRDDCEVLSFVREEPHNPLDKEFRKKFPVKDVDGKSSSRRKRKLKRRMRRFALRCLCCIR